MKLNFQPTLFRDISPGWGAAIQGGGSLLGDIFNLFGQSKANREQEAYNTSVMQMQRQWSLQDIAAQNAYNSPVQQMARYREAGLNPNLIYGEGVTASSGQSDMPRSVPSPSFAPANVASSFANLGNQLGSAVGTYQDLQKTPAQVSNVNADTVNKQKHAVYQDIENTIKKSDGRADPTLNEFFREADMANAGNEREIKYNEARASKVLDQRVTTEIHNMQDANDRANALNARQQALQAPTLQAAIQQVQNMVEQNAGMRQANINAAAELKRIQESTHVMELDAQLRSGNMNKEDIYKVVQPLVDVLILRYLKNTPGSSEKRSAPSVSPGESSDRPWQRMDEITWPSGYEHR